MNIKEKLKKTWIYSLYYYIRRITYPITLKIARIYRNKPSKMAVQISDLSDKRLIISLTTFPSRINLVHKALYSLMNQNYKPDMIILWLAEEQFKNREADLPKSIVDLKQYGLTIMWTEKDLKSYKKLIPTLEMYPEDIIITADDDLYYPCYWVENLVKSYNKNPQDIHCHLITRLGYIDKMIIVDRRYKDQIDSASYNNKILGGSGTLYPPHSLAKEVLNKEMFVELAPTSDDIWFWGMALKNRTKIRWIKNNMKKLYYVEGSQDTTECLCSINDNGEMLFYTHINNVINRYNLKEALIEQGSI